MLAENLDQHYLYTGYIRVPLWYIMWPTLFNIVVGLLSSEYGEMTEQFPVNALQSLDDKWFPINQGP